MKNDFGDKLYEHPFIAFFVCLAISFTSFCVLAYFFG